MDLPFFRGDHEDTGTSLDDPDLAPGRHTESDQRHVCFNDEVDVRTISEEGDMEVQQRETWQQSLDFLISCIGYSVGLGSVWRFPFLCYQNGGGAFLIPYSLALVVGGIPMVYLEVALGQYMSASGPRAWRIVPIFQGIGIASGMVVFYLSCYYSVIMSWIFYYFLASFTSDLPWRTCGHEWNTANCTEHFQGLEDNEDISTETDPVTEFWENKVLNISEGINQMGEIKRDLALCLFLGWIVVFCCIFQGIRTSRKVVYFTAISPYVLMVVLMVRNAMLEGSYDGIYYYLTPDAGRLADIKVWVDAGSQIFYSIGTGFGTILALGSYNKFNYNSYRDAIIFSVVSPLTSILAGFIVFSSLGYMAKQQKRSVADVAETGPGLAFIAYPTAVSQMPASPFWSILFFLMLSLLALDSQFLGVEGILTMIVDEFPSLLRRRDRRMALSGVVCFAMFLVGTPMVYQGGMYLFHIFDNYAGSHILFVLVLVEVVAIVNVYGVHRFVDNIKMMLGTSINHITLKYLQLCWMFLTPLYCSVLCLLSWATYRELSYTRHNGPTYYYPGWGIALGWTLAASSIIWIPIVALYLCVKHRFNRRVLKLLLVPYNLESHQMRPQDLKEEHLYDHERMIKLKELQNL